MFKMNSPPPPPPIKTTSNNKQNKWNFICFCLVTGIQGIEYGFIVPTLFSYLKDEVHAKHLNFWFGAITSSFFVASIVGSLTIGKYADRTRKIRRIIVGTCFFVSLGNIIYTLAYNAPSVLVGRFMQGFGDAVVPVLIGEITKTYPEQESYKKLSMMTTIFYAAYISSPVITTVFSACNFRLLGIHFTVYTAPAYLIGVCWFSLGIVCYFVVKNPSTACDDIMDPCHPSSGDKPEPNLIESKNNPTVLPNSTSNYGGSSVSNTKQILSNDQFRMVLLVTGLSAYFAASFFTIYTPMVANIFYQLPTYWMSTLFTSCAVTLIIVLHVSSKYNLINENEIYFAICGLCSVVMTIQLLINSVVLFKHKMLGEALLALCTITTGFTFSVEQVVLAGLVAKCVPQSSQSYAASIRRSTNSFCFICGSFVAPIISKYLLVHGLVFSSLVFFLILYLIAKRKMFEGENIRR